ncbi:HupE/UreJ family protein [Rhizobium sp. ICMP 5592]|uniref:HupE/UreJ family protein n=1 Tax=Rhizobium sp. ICMP 5592 TaxID=2292445 RepID=UPI00188675E8|nr:HupE/UreJ family protein [Rhizobium sp. ICMP 5592]
MSLTVSVSAHRLDEYLQATTIGLARDHVALQLRLTPGVDVASKVLAEIDTNRDGVISQDEQQAYADRVRQDLSLAVDGNKIGLRLVSAAFPSANQMTKALGEMLLLFRADCVLSGAEHSLAYENRHDRPLTVYLVNTLMPDTADIQITGQTRSFDQSSYRLDFNAGSTPNTKQGLERGDARSIVVTYFLHGVHHILTGFDHLLFISALVLAATTLWDLVKVVSAFTVAHSITLALAALGLVHIPEAVVEPVIAASIVFVAIQNIFSPGHARGGSRLIVAFIFGLFHGLGFAGGLLEIMYQMQAQTVILAIFGFSLGVEAANQLVLLPLFAALKFVPGVRSDSTKAPRISGTIRQVGSVATSLAGTYYLALALAGVA